MKEKDKQGFGLKTKASLKRMERVTLTGNQSNGGAMPEAIDKYAFTDDDDVGSGKEKDKKRISHNTMEKKRKDKISKNILYIQTLLPPEYRNQKQKDSLTVILEKTATYLQDMQDKVQRCMMGEADDVRAQEAESLRQKVQELTDLNQQYVDLLRSSDVPEDLLLQPDLIKQWKSKGKSSLANQTAAAADSTNQSSPEPEMSQEKESDWSNGSGSKRNRGNTVQEHLKRMEGMREATGSNGDNPVTMEMSPFPAQGFPRMLPGGTGMPLIVAGPNGQPQILPAGIDPSQMGMFIPPGMPCYPGAMMPSQQQQQQQLCESVRDLSQNDDPLMTLARAAGSSPMLSPTPQMTTSTNAQEEQKGSEQDGATSSTDILSRAVSQSGMQLSPDPQNDNPEIEDEDKAPIVSASTEDQQEITDTNVESQNRNEMSQTPVGDSGLTIQQQQPDQENPAGPPNFSMPLSVPPVSQGLPSIPPFHMGPLQGRLVFQNGQLILLNDNSQPNLLPGSSAGPQNLLSVPGSATSTGGIWTSSIPGQIQPPLMSVAKQPGQQLATQSLPGQQLPGQGIQGQLPGQPLQQLGNQPLPGLPQLQGQQFLGQQLGGQQLGGQQLGMPGFQMPNFILNSNGQLIMTNPPPMLGPQQVGNDGQMQQIGAIQSGGQLQPGGQIQQPGHIQPGSFVGVKNVSGTPGNLPQALLLPNGQIVPVVTQPSMLFPGCQAVPGGVLFPKNPGAAIMPPGGQMPTPLNIPTSGVLQNGANLLMSTAMSMVGQVPQPLFQQSGSGLVMTSVATTVSPAFPAVNLQAGTSGLVSGVRPSLISVSKSPFMTTSIGPPVSMTTSVNTDGNDSQIGSQPQVIVSQGLAQHAAPNQQVSIAGTKSDASSTVATTTAHISNSNGASTTAMAILNPDGTLVLTLPPGAQPNNLVLDPNTMPAIKTSSANQVMVNVKKGGKKSGQRVLMPKPTLSGGIMTLPGMPVPSLAPTIISNPSQMQHLLFNPPVSNTQTPVDLEKPKQKQAVKSEAAAPLVVNVDPPVTPEVTEKKTGEPDLLAQATESIFSNSLSEISPPVSSLYHGENDEDALQIDTSAQETEDTSQTTQNQPIVLQEEQHRPPSPLPPVSSSFHQEALLVPTAAPPVVNTEPLPPKKKKKKKKKADKTDISAAAAAAASTSLTSTSAVLNTQQDVSVPVPMIVTTAQSTLPSESVVTMTTASELSHSVACTTQVSTVSDSTFSMPSYFPYPMTPLSCVSTDYNEKTSTIDASALLSPDAKPKKSKKKKDSSAKESNKSIVEQEKTTPPAEKSGPLASTPKTKKKSKKEKNNDVSPSVPTASTPTEQPDKQLNAIEFFPESISFSESDLNSVLDQVCRAPVEKLGSVVEPVTPSSGKKKSHKRKNSEGNEESPKKKKKKKKKAVEEVIEETNDSFTTDILERAMKDIGPLEMDLEEDSMTSDKHNQSDDLDKSISDSRSVISKLNDSDDGPAILIMSRSPSPVFNAKDISDINTAPKDAYSAPKDAYSAPKDAYSAPNVLKDNMSTSRYTTNSANILKDSDCALNKGTNMPYGTKDASKNTYGISTSKELSSTMSSSKYTASKDDLRVSSSDVLPSSLSILSSIAAEPIETTDLTKTSSTLDFPKSSASTSSRFSYNASDSMSNFSYAPKPYNDMPPDVVKSTVPPQSASVNTSAVDTQGSLTSLSSVSSTPLSHARHSNIATIARGITPTKHGPVPAIASKMARYQQQQQKMQQQQQQQQQNQQNQQNQQHSQHSKSSSDSCSNPLTFSSCSEMQSNSSKSTHNEVPSCGKENPMGPLNVPLQEAPTGNNSSCKLGQVGGNMQNIGRPQVGGGHDMMSQPRSDSQKDPIRAPPASRTPKSAQEDVSGSEASPRSSGSGTPALHIDTFSPPTSFSSHMLFSPGKGPGNHPSGPPGGAMSMQPPNAPPPQQQPPVAKPTPPVMTSPPQQPVKPPGPPQMQHMQQQPQISQQQQPTQQMSQPPQQQMSQPPLQQQPVMPPPPLSHQTPPSMQNDPKPHHHPNILSRAGRMEKEQPPSIPPIQVSSSDHGNSSHGNSSHGNRNSGHNKGRSMYSEGLQPVSNQPTMSQAKDLFMTVSVPSNMPPYNNNVTDMRERVSYSRSPGISTHSSQTGGMSSAPYSTSSGTSTFSFTLSSASSSAATTTTPSTSNATYSQFPSHFPFYPPGLHPHQVNSLRPNHPGPHLGLANFMAARDMRPPHYLSHPPRPGSEGLMSPHQQRGAIRYQEQEINRRSNPAANVPPSSHNSPYTSDSSTYRGDKEMSTPLSHSPMNSSGRSGSVGRSPHPDVPAFFPGHPGFSMMTPVSHAHQAPSSQSPGSLMATPPLHHRGNQGSSANNQGRSYEGPHLPHGAQFNFSPPGFEPPQLHLPPRESHPPPSRGDHYSSQMMHKQQNQAREDSRKQAVQGNHGNTKQGNVQSSGQGSQKSRSKQSKKARQYEIDTNLANSIFESGRCVTPLFPMPSISPPPRNPEAPTYLSSHLFGNSSRPLSSSTPLQHKGSAPSELNFNPLFPPARPQNSLGLNFQPGFGMNPAAMHGQMPSGNQVPAHSGHFSLSNLFPDSAVSQAPDGLNISPIKFPPHLSHQPMDHNLSHSHQPSSGMYGQRPHPSHHPPVLHNMSINTLLGHGPHGPPMGPPINSSMASAFGGHTHASFGMPLNFPLHEH